MYMYKYIDVYVYSWRIRVYDVCILVGCFEMLQKNSKTFKCQPAGFSNDFVFNHYP